MKKASSAMSDEANITNAGQMAHSVPRVDDRRPSKFVIPLLAWVVAGFLFLAVLWSIMFTAARSANVQSVPLATQGAKR